MYRQSSQCKSQQQLCGNDISTVPVQKTTRVRTPVCVLELGNGLFMKYEANERERYGTSTEMRCHYTFTTLPGNSVDISCY